MKRSFIIIYSFVLLIASCKEKGPKINFTDPIVADTTFLVSPVPAVDTHNVLAEEFTGQSCPNCPAAHELLNSLAANGRLNIIGLYVYGVAQATPPAGHAYDFRDSTATDICTAIYGGAPLSGIPCGGIDRVPVGGQLAPYAGAWTNAISLRQNIPDSLNLSLHSGYNAVDSIDTVIATVTYTTQVSTPQSLSIAVVEDSIIDLQETTSGTDPNYVFTNVFRGMIPGANGTDILTAYAVKAPGRVDRRTYLYKPKAGMKAKNCRLIAFVSYSSTFSSKAVLQSVQTKMIP